MAPREVLVIAETPSLAESIADLLRGEGIPCRLVANVEGSALATDPEQEPRLIVVACNESYCGTARKWARGELANARLLVVGSRDPKLASIQGIRTMPLPLVVESFVRAVRGYIGASPRMAAVLD